MEVLAVRDDDACTVKELLAEMTGEEMYSAQYETSNLYNSLVMVKAIEIVKRSTGLNNHSLMTKLNISRNTYYKWMNTKAGIHNKMFEVCMERLALIRETAGEDYGIHKQTR